ncbi:basic salivary proline-rich protein 2-like [Rousettus aegyptiacus]|uniref:basic salivary proline-rich protein 2-like n=1 Tax=Rousettus aegyptiacus TaxID=9407 RepID=UPI00168D2A46|nr:basic salivary proline-rich protein 2-like [Rousettus aegyptiacus]
MEPPAVSQEQLLGALRVTAVAGASQLWICDRNQLGLGGQDGSTVNPERPEPGPLPESGSVHVGTWAPDQQTKPARNDSFPAAQAWRPTGDPVTEQRGAPPGLAGRPGSRRDLRAGVGSDAGHPQCTEVRRRPLSSQATAQAAPSRPSAPGPPPPAPEGPVLHQPEGRRAGGRRLAGSGEPECGLRGGPPLHAVPNLRPPRHPPRSTSGGPVARAAGNVLRKQPLEPQGPNHVPAGSVHPCAPEVGEGAWLGDSRARLLQQAPGSGQAPPPARTSPPLPPPPGTPVPSPVKWQGEALTLGPSEGQTRTCGQHGHALSTVARVCGGECSLRPCPVFWGHRDSQEPSASGEPEPEPAGTGWVSPQGSALAVVGASRAL